MKEPVVEPVEPIVEEIIEPIVVEEKPAPVKVDKLKQIVKCPDCSLEMTQHTLKHIDKRRGFCKAVKTPEPEKNSTRTSSTTKTKDYRRYCKWLY